jgi:hypothetical protein
MHRRDERDQYGGYIDRSHFWPRTASNLILERNATDVASLKLPASDISGFFGERGEAHRNAKTSWIKNSGEVGRFRDQRPHYI